MDTYIISQGLVKATAKNLIENVKFLLKYSEEIGLDVNVKDSNGRETAFFHACGQSLELVKLFFNHKDILFGNDLFKVNFFLNKELFLASILLISTTTFDSNLKTLTT